jgi:hypothetical protein
MAQTPKSLSANVSTLLPTTIYTVPAGTTAVVKSIIPATNLANQTITLNKLSSGTTYPIFRTYSLPNTPATGASQINSPNMLAGPITLAANESLTASVTSTTALNAQKTSVITNTAYQMQSGSPVFTCSVYANGIYMVTGYFSGTGGVISQNNGFVLTSTNGSTWTFQSAFPTGYSQLQTVVYGGSVWVALGFDSNTNNSATVWTSSNNGVAWTKVTLPSSTSWAYQIWYVNGNFIVADYQAYIYVSTDGITWTRKTGARDLDIGNSSNAGNKIRSVNYVNSIYFFGTLGGTIISTDLTTYTSAYTVNNLNNSAIYFGYIQYSAINSTWYAFGSTPSNSSNTETYPILWSSSDGINWTWNTTLYSANILTGGYTPIQFAVSKSGTNANIWMAASQVASNSLTYSTNGGTSWTRGTNASGYKGVFRTLSNGAYVQYYQAQDDTNSVTTYVGIWGINVNPALTTVGAQASMGTHSYGLTGNYMAVASNGTGWVGWINTADDGTSKQFGGASSTTCAFYANLTTNNYPICATWLPATSKYYMITDTGYVYSTTAYNTAVTSLGQVPGFSGAYASVTIATIGTYLVVNNGTLTKYSTDGITWTTATLPATTLFGDAGVAGQGVATDGTKLINLYTSNQVVVTTDGTTYTTMPYPDGLCYQATVNGNNFAVFYSTVAVNNTGSYNVTYTSPTYANYPTGYTKLTVSGFGSPAYNSANVARLNVGLINYSNSLYNFSISTQSADGSTVGITTSSDLLNYTNVRGTSVLNLNGTDYYSYTSGTLCLATNGSGQFVFVDTNNANGTYLTTGSLLAVPTTLTAGIIEVS